MPRTIWKFKIDNRELPPDFVLTMPKGAKIIHAGIDPNGELCIWAIVDPQAVVEMRKFHIMGTGWEVPKDGQWISTLLDGAFVWHLFELPTI